MKLKVSILSIALVSFLAAEGSAYTVGGASSVITPESTTWAWNNSDMADFRGALENPAFFGPGGVVNETIVTTTLNTVDAASLATVDMFIAPWVGDGDAPAFSAAVQNFFLGGGDLFLLQDDSNHDFLGTTLGMSTTNSDGSVSNGGAPFFDGPFGTASDVTQHYNVGKLDPAEIAAANGNVVGTNVSGQVTSAYWAAGQYAPTAGALFIIADVDMIASTSGGGGVLNGAIYGLTLGDLNDNAIYALNTFSFLKDGNVVPPDPVPEPATMILFGAGLVGLLASKIRRKK